MNGSGLDVISSSYDITDISEISGTIQFTNCLDGLLRDANGDIIRMNRSDFIHQAYCGLGVGHVYISRDATRFVFRDGRLSKVMLKTC